MASHGHPIQRTWDLTPEDVVVDGLRRIRGIGQSYRLALIIAGILGALGLVAIVIGPLVAGYGNRQVWTYVAVAFGYLMSTVAAAPCLSAGLRLARGHWRRPVQRVSEIWAAALIVPLILFFFLVWVLPGTADRATVWFGWPASPWLWDALLMLGLAIAGYGFLYLSSLPDLAVVRDRVDGQRNGLVARLSRDWYGLERQWRVLERGISIIGSLYIILYIGTMTVISADFVQSLIPAFNSAIFPAYIVVSSGEAAIALTIVTAAALRKWGGAEAYLGREQFFALAKMQLALGLLFVYFTWTEFVIPWYGRMPHEVGILRFLFFETYFWPFFLAVVLNFGGPLFILMWTRVRQSITGPTIAACGVLIGILLDRIRWFSGAFSPTAVDLESYHHGLVENIPPAYIPGLLDLLILFGALGATVALVLVAFRLIPYPSIWEVTAGLRLRARKRYEHTEVIVIAKPD